jgi:hypothetical protein
MIESKWKYFSILNGLIPLSGKKTIAALIETGNKK